MEDKTFEENLVNEGMPQADADKTEAEEERHDGQIKCPKCGATDIELNPKQVSSDVISVDMSLNRS